MKDEAKYLAEEDHFWSAVGARPERIRVHLNRSDVTVRLQTLGDGPPVVFVHGAMTGGACFGSLAVRVRDLGYECLLLDRPGTCLFPHAELELVPGTGHAPWFDHLDRAAETMDRFFSRSRGTAPSR